MSRSIHTTKKDLARERRFAQNDGVATSEDGTEFERADINKSVRKLNESRKRHAEKHDAPASAHLALGKADLVRTVRKRRTSAKTSGEAGEKA